MKYHSNFPDVFLIALMGTFIYWLCSLLGASDSVTLIAVATGISTTSINLR